jgi:hypothetical protein
MSRMSIFLIYTYYLPILILILNLGQLVLIYVSAYKIQDTLFSKSGGHDTTFIISTYTINKYYVCRVYIICVFLFVSTSHFDSMFVKMYVCMLRS